VIVEGPYAIPVILGAVRGAVAPAGMMNAGVTVTLDVSLLVRVMNTELLAGDANVTGNDNV
jgi:hypothetical protein